MKPITYTGECTPEQVFYLFALWARAESADDNEIFGTWDLFVHLIPQEEIAELLLLYRASK